MDFQKQYLRIGGGKLNQVIKEAKFKKQCC